MEGALDATKRKRAHNLLSNQNFKSKSVTLTAREMRENSAAPECLAFSC